MSSKICPACGSPNPPDSVFCTACGASLASAITTPPPPTTTAPPPPPTTTYPPPPPAVYPPKERPSGVTLLGMLAIVGGILQIVSGAILSAIFNTGVFFVLFLIIGLFYFVTGWGLLNLKKWSWYLALILALIGLLGVPIGTIISIIIIWYLFKVKNYFGV